MNRSVDREFTIDTESPTATVNLFCAECHAKGFRLNICCGELRCDGCDEQHGETQDLHSVVKPWRSSPSRP